MRRRLNSAILLWTANERRTIWVFLTGFPVHGEPGTLYRAEPDQPRVFGLYHLNQVAIELGSGLDFLDVVARLIWNGETTNWHEESTMCSVIERAGLDYDLLSRRVEKEEQTYMRIYAENAETLHASGHWGGGRFRL
jgi:2-hydroxychromene-2-carboxylate isomerase